MRPKRTADLDLLRSIYRHLDKDAVLAERPSLTTGDLDAFFRKMAAVFSDSKGAARPARRPKVKSVAIYSDGGSRGNPGPAGYGAVLTDPSGKVLAELSEFVGRKTNNEAEYLGLIAGLEAARDMGAREVRIRADSELLVRQVNGTYKMKSARLRPLLQEVQALLGAFQTWSAQHVPRERNAHADRLANEAMDRAR